MYTLLSWDYYIFIIWSSCWFAIVKGAVSWIYWFALFAVPAIFRAVWFDTIKWAVVWPMLLDVAIRRFLAVLSRFLKRRAYRLVQFLHGAVIRVPAPSCKECMMRRQCSTSRDQCQRHGASSAR